MKSVWSISGSKPLTNTLLPSLPQRNGAKARPRKIAKAPFSFIQCNRTSWVELVPGIAAAIHNDVSFHGTLTESWLVNGQIAPCVPIPITTKLDALGLANF